MVRLMKALFGFFEDGSANNPQLSILNVAIPFAEGAFAAPCCSEVSGEGMGVMLPFLSMVPKEKVPPCAEITRINCCCISMIPLAASLSVFRYAFPLKSQVVDRKRGGEGRRCDI